VLLQNVVFPNKLTPTFDQTEFEVLERHNNIVKIAGGGRTLIRNVAHLKKIPGDVSVAPAPELGILQTIPASFQEALEDQPSKAPAQHSPSKVKPLKLRLINKGGMWEPVPNSDATGTSSDVTDAGAGETR